MRSGAALAASAFPRLLPDLAWVACPVCGGTQPVPTWNEPEQEPPATALSCLVPTCARPFQASV